MLIQAKNIRPTFFKECRSANFWLVSGILCWRAVFSNFRANLKGPGGLPHTDLFVKNKNVKIT
jgi:hypothetical protein